MLEDRSYMRRDRWRPQWSFTIILLLVNVAVFVAQGIVDANSTFDYKKYFALSREGLSHAYLWQPLTFQFLHGGVWHLVLNLLGIYFFGRVVEDRLGRAAFLKLYLLSGVVGGLFQALLGLVFERFGGQVVGASAGVFGLIAASSLMEPDGIILVSFILPIRAKYFLIIITALAVFFVFFPGQDNIAHAAHLGGIIAGLAYLRWGALAENLFRVQRPVRIRFRPRELIKVQGSKDSPWKRGKERSTDDLPAGEFISREVDPILDKISAHGIQSLTPRERQILEAARAKMEKR
jgi:membrane associated rhomboid family serine protease